VVAARQGELLGTRGQRGRHRHDLNAAHFLRRVLANRSVVACHVRRAPASCLTAA